MFLAQPAAIKVRYSDDKRAQNVRVQSAVCQDYSNAKEELMVKESSSSKNSIEGRVMNAVTSRRS